MFGSEPEPAVTEPAEEKMEGESKGPFKLELPLPGNPDLGFNGKDYTTMPSNQTISREINCPKVHLHTFAVI